MPTIRCSNEAYELLQGEALRQHEPVSIVLDRLIFLGLKGQTSGTTRVKRATKGRATKRPAAVTKRARAAKKRSGTLKKSTGRRKEWLAGVVGLTE